ncbi:hypothetical protein SDC9_139103 [bioreactor metagenome]|uniref:Uncharacterized protein n=1 Tax=bioreactor metagenome TaxID=1076179 RepID=A0A645DRS9_9ZZZZ
MLRADMQHATFHMRDALDAFVCIEAFKRFLGNVDNDPARFNVAVREDRFTVFDLHTTVALRYLTDFSI